MRSPYLLLALAPFFWSCNWIIGRALHHDVPPMGMTFFRWLFAVLMLAPFAIGPLRRDWPIVRANWRMMLMLGAIGVGMHNALAYVGLNFTTATNGVILNSCIPVMIVVMARVFFGERLRRLQLAGVVVSSLGVLAIFSRGSLQTLAALRLNAGDVFVLLSVAMWSLYTILLRHRPAGLHMLSFLFSIAIVGNLCMLPFWIGEMLLGYRIAWTAQTVSAMLAVALFSSVLAYIFWNRGVEAVGPQVAGLFVHLMPVFGVLLAWIFLGERLHPYHVAGIALILIGIVLTTRRARPASTPAAAAGMTPTAGAKPAEVRK
jgi:drug/metabolite transporter (DMT)-like permease